MEQKGVSAGNWQIKKNFTKGITKELAEHWTLASGAYDLGERLRSGGGLLSQNLEKKTSGEPASEGGGQGNRQKEKSRLKKSLYRREQQGKWGFEEPCGESAVKKGRGMHKRKVMGSLMSLSAKIGTKKKKANHLYGGLLPIRLGVQQPFNQEIVKHKEQSIRRGLKGKTNIGAPGPGEFVGPEHGWIRHWKRFTNGECRLKNLPERGCRSNGKSKAKRRVKRGGKKTFVTQPRLGRGKKGKLPGET